MKNICKTYLLKILKLNRLKKFKQKRKQKNVDIFLQKLQKSLHDNTNLLPIVIECIKNHCSLGEICQTMRDVHGEYL